MALAPYFSRVSDAVSAVAGLTADELTSLLGDTVVHADLSRSTAQHPEWAGGVGLLGNLLGRLYPTLSASGPKEAVAAFTAAALRSNPQLTVACPGAGQATVRFGDHEGPDLSVSASGWVVSVDDDPPHGSGAPQRLAALVAACLAASELFREVFADVLGPHARRTPQPGALDIVSGDAERPAPPTGVAGTDIGTAHLSGAGAIGEACALALATSGATGRLTVVDPESLELPNVQRYVLSTVDDVGTPKTEIVARELVAAGWVVEQVPTAWGADARSAPGREKVLVALDTARDRLGVAAGLHERVYNAWTQPADIGWSRHERFGIDPCLACLYYPDAQRPSDDEQIAAALQQERLRVLSYLVTGVPVGLPLPGLVEVADLPAPTDAQRWTRVPLLADLAELGMVPVGQHAAWAGRLIGDLYADGICGGGLVHPDRAELPAEVIVPLAHQSALAGVMLAVQALAAAIPELAAARPEPVEGRLDLMRGLPQIVARPRARTPGCFCADPAYQDAAGPPSRLTAATMR